MILKDVFLLKNFQIISESKENKTLKIRGTFQRADEANANKRIYPKTVLESNVKRLQPLIENRALLGELDHPELEATRLSNAAVLITKLGLKGNEVIGEAEILNTPGGKIVKTLIEDKVTIGISSRGVGNLLPEAREDGVKYVSEDYKLITFDIVADPSTRGAYPQVCESKEQKYLDNVIKKAFGEEILIALTKDMISSPLNEAKKGLKHTQRVIAGIAKRSDQGRDKPGDNELFYKKVHRQTSRDRRRGIVPDEEGTHKGGGKSERDHEVDPSTNIKRGRFHSQDEAILYYSDKILQEGLFRNVAATVGRAAFRGAKAVARNAPGAVRKVLDMPRTKDAGEHAFYKQREKETKSRMANLKGTRKSELKAYKSRLKTHGTNDPQSQELRGNLQRRNSKLAALKDFKGKAKKARGILAFKGRKDSPSSANASKVSKPVDSPSVAKKVVKVAKKAVTPIKHKVMIAPNVKSAPNTPVKVAASKSDSAKANSVESPPTKVMPVVAKKKKSLTATPANKILARKQTILKRRKATSLPPRAPTQLAAPLNKKKKESENEAIQYYTDLICEGIRKSKIQVGDSEEAGDDEGGYARAFASDMTNPQEFSPKTRKRTRTEPEDTDGDDTVEESVKLDRDKVLAKKKLIDLSSPRGFRRKQSERNRAKAGEILKRNMQAKNEDVLDEGDRRAVRLDLASGKAYKNAQKARDEKKLHVRKHLLDKGDKLSSMAKREKAKGMFRKSFKQKDTDPLSSEKNRRIASSLMKYSRPNNTTESIVNKIMEGSSGKKKLDRAISSVGKKVMKTAPFTPERGEAASKIKDLLAKRSKKHKSASDRVKSQNPGKSSAQQGIEPKGWPGLKK